MKQNNSNKKDLKRSFFIYKKKSENRYQNINNKEGKIVSTKDIPTCNCIKSKEDKDGQ